MPFRLVLLFILPMLAPAALAQVAAEDDKPYEVVVVGRQPGPPLWKVSNGDNVLWIFPYLTPVPKNLDWETDKVAKAIAASQEVLERPELNARASPLLLLNPINIVRGVRLMRRVTRNPDDATLDQVVPADLYARYVALKSQYFPKEKDFERMRPFMVAGAMERRIHDEENLESGDAVEKTLKRQLRKNRKLNYTPIQVEIRLEGGFGELADRAETLIDSLDHEDELKCFAQTLREMEKDIEERKYRADLWSRGYIDEFRMIPLAGTEEDLCFMLLVGGSEKDNIAAARTELDTLWLTEAERALNENPGTFATLAIQDLIRADGPLARLKEKGYTVVEP